MDKIEHVVVLMMENRSFDHMLGYLDHPAPHFPNLTKQQSNPDEHGNSIMSSDSAAFTIEPGPGHEHEDIMEQLFHGQNQNTEDPSNKGFVINYAEQGKKQAKGDGQKIMRSMHESKIPIFSKLAKEYAVCTKWFCSVPGSTWPNRNFVHAATSDKEVNSSVKFYKNPTIFERLSKAKKPWVIFHDGIPQSLAFKRLWLGSLFKRKKHFCSMRTFYGRARKGKLPAYSFIEPDHMGSDSNSFHPGYIADDPSAFIASDKLLARIYNALTTNKNAWRKTVFVITFDEHGGFYDRESPPKTTPPEKPATDDEFDFDRLGVRVPTLIISPWIEKATLDDTEYDHTSIIKTVRLLFAPNSDSLTGRDRDANHFLNIFNRDTPRLTPVKLPNAAKLPKTALEAIESKPELDEFQESLVELSKMVSEEISDKQTIQALESFPIMSDDKKSNFQDIKDVDKFQKDVLDMLRKRK